MGINKVKIGDSVILDISGASTNLSSEHLALGKTVYDGNGDSVEGQLEDLSSAYINPTFDDSSNVGHFSRASGFYIPPSPSQLNVRVTTDGLKSENIKRGVTILGVDGSGTVVDVKSDTLAYEDDLPEGVVAHNKEGNVITGTSIKTSGTYDIDNISKSWQWEGPRCIVWPQTLKVQIAPTEVSKIVADNIRGGVTILGVSGSPSVIETNDVTLSTSHYLPSGVSAYSNGTKYTGDAVFMQSIEHKYIENINQVVKLYGGSSGVFIKHNVTEGETTTEYGYEVSILLSDQYKLIPANIRGGVKVLGVEGSPYVVNVQEDTLSSEHELPLGVIAHSQNGRQITGDVESLSGTEEITSEIPIISHAGPLYIPNGSAFTVKISDLERETIRRDNIRRGVTILGVTGSDTVVDVKDASTDLTASCLILGKSAYDGNGNKIEGSLPTLSELLLTFSDESSTKRLTQPNGLYLAPDPAYLDITISSPNLLENNIKSGVKILGVEGKAILSTEYGVDGKLILGACTKFILTEDISTIRPYMFYNFTTLTEVQGLEHLVGSIGQYAFCGCKGLTTFEASNITYVSQYAFSGCTALSTVTLGGSVIYDGAFEGCSSLESIEMTSVRYIGKEAFQGCTSLAGTIDLPNVTSIGESAFYNCTSLYQVLLTYSSITSLPAHIFYGCSSLQYFVAPMSLKYINDEAFMDCRSLVQVDVGLAATLGSNVFENCVSLKTVIGDELTTIGSGSFRGCVKLTSFSCPGVMLLNNDLFNGCTDMETIYINAVTTIKDYVFNGCTKLTTVYGDKIRIIGNNAFCQCTALTTINLENVTTIGDSAFYNCYNISAVLPSATSVGASAFFQSNTTVLDAPKLKTIGSRAFGNCTQLASINIKEVTTIGEWAFRGCSALAEAELDSVISLGNGAFYVCTSLEKVNASQLLTIGNYAFESCDNLLSITAPNVATIGKEAFYTCEKLGEMSCYNVTSVGAHAFYGCTNLSIVNINDAQSIGDFAFNYCTSLQTITINGIKTLGEGVFFGCDNLTNITLQSGVKVAPHASASEATKIVTVDGHMYSQNGEITNFIYCDDTLIGELTTENKIVKSEYGVTFVFVDESNYTFMIVW